MVCFKLNLYDFIRGCAYLDKTPIKTFSRQATVVLPDTFRVNKICGVKTYMDL